MFLLRFRGKHLFNPPAVAVATLLLVSDRVWVLVSPGQWLTATWLILLIVSAGGLVLTRSDRLDTAAGFALCYGGLLTWLNQNGNKEPCGAEPTIAGYIRQNRLFFVVRATTSCARSTWNTPRRSSNCPSASAP